MWMGKNGGCTMEARALFQEPLRPGRAVDVEDGTGSRIGEKNGSPRMWS